MNMRCRQKDAVGLNLKQLSWAGTLCGKSFFIGTAQSTADVFYTSIPICRSKLQSLSPSHGLTKSHFFGLVLAGQGWCCLPILPVTMRRGRCHSKLSPCWGFNYLSLVAADGGIERNGFWIVPSTLVWFETMCCSSSRGGLQSGPVTFWKSIPAYSSY